MYSTEGPLNLLSLTLVIILIAIMQNEYITAKAQEQQRLNTTSVGNYTGEGNNPFPASTSAAADAIARGFIQQLKEMTQQRKQSNSNKTGRARHQQTRQAFLDYFHDEGNIGLIGPNYKERKDRISAVASDFGNSSETKLKEQSGSRGQFKEKATDYYFNPLASLSSHNGKNSRQYKNGNDIVNGETGSKIDGDTSLVALVKPAAISTLPKIIIKQPLDSKEKPAVDFEVNSNAIMFVFQVDEEERENYFLSVVVERMNCHIENETTIPKLYIRGEHEELSLCKTFDNSLSHFQSVDHLTSGDKILSIKGEGDWKNTSAFLVVSIFTEASHCSYCPADHFCCGRKDNACKYSSMIATGKNKDKDSSSASFSAEYTKQRYRCIPKQNIKGEPLICNGHPNCGFHCNQDELTANCPKDDDDNNDCAGYYCREDQQDRFLITIILLIIFCVFVPFCIFLFLCSRKELRREFGRRGRCPVPLEIIFCPFSINPEEPARDPPSTTASATGPRQNRSGDQSRTRGYARRAFRRTEEVNSGREAPPGVDNRGYFDDLPPPYSECYNDKVMFPSPPKVTGSSNGIPVTGRDIREMPTVSRPTFQLQPITPGVHQVPVTQLQSNQDQILTTSLTSSQVGEASVEAVTTSNTTSQ